MSARMLGLGLLSLANTANAWRPISRHESNPSMLAFALGWPTSELPLHVLASHIALAGLLLVKDDERDPRSTAGLALMGVSAVGLLGLERSARDAGRVLEDALAAGLGEAAGGSPDADDAPEAQRPGALRVMRIRARYAHDADVPYGPHGSRNHLDIWRRPDRADGSAAAPVLLQIPGGAWSVGNKEGQAYPLMSHLADRGWVCVSMSYRLSPRTAWPGHIVDVKRAIAWIKARISEYGGDPEFIAITGGSAGGHLSALAALTPGDPAFQPEFEDADTSVQAAVPMYGAYDWIDTEHIGHRGLQGFIEKKVVQKPFAENQELYEQASPLFRVTPEAPPFFLLHGTNDSLIPVEQGRAFADRLREVSRSPVVYAELPQAQHAFDFFGSLRAAATAAAVERFLDAVRGGVTSGASRPQSTYA
jgi:acetyl esterase/lipase